MSSLFDIPVGQTVTISRLGGSGAFHARLGELGFVPGLQVKKLYTTPLHDPQVFELMGSQVSLRAVEARSIYIDKSPTPAPYREGGESRHHLTYTSHHHCSGFNGNPACMYCHHDGRMIHEDPPQAGEITLALVGNPNCGKTSLFNAASGGHERTGNYSGVTVHSVVGHMEFEGKKLRIVDLPGTYSLRAYSPEEAYVASELETGQIDAVVNVLDSGNLERNLLLTLQLRRRNLPVVCALNMYDELEDSGSTLDVEALSQRMDIPMIPTVARTGRGIDDLLRTAISLAEERKANPIETSTDCLADDDEQDDTERYATIRTILNGIYKRREGDTSRHTAIIDRLLARGLHGYLLFVGIMALIFWLTFTIGQYPMDWLETFIEWGGGMLSEVLPAGFINDLVTQGIFGGVGAVIVFLPNILILYFLISLLEDSGYLARAAMLADPLFSRLGLHGKSFIPLLMGFGCNVPAVMSTRIIENSKSRILTMLALPFMSCSARIPIYVLFAGTFFPDSAALVMLGLYLTGIIMALLTAGILSRFYRRDMETHFVMELPPYRRPTWNSVVRHTWEQGRQYLHKMGTVILGASIVIFILSYFPRGTAEMSHSEQQEQSYLGCMGKAIEPVFAPQGFDWRMGMGIIAGMGAKEMMVGTLGVIYNAEDDAVEDLALTDINHIKHSSSPSIQSALLQNTTHGTALAYLVFALLYFPCIATIMAIRTESGSWRLTTFVAIYTTTIAYIASALVGLAFA
ncbi:MAG: ferrous iron transport protein B [Bacteroidaceae bacterium]|nr:ferrous iron transport protein B [Bacteroidaceae bacterium]